jgi:translation initiation factor 2 subunit 1
MAPNEYPNIDDIVVVIVDSITSYGFQVTLPEYNNIEGLVIYNESSRRKQPQRINSVRCGQQRSAVVLRVDKDKKYIDLSIKRVSPEDNEKCFDKYAKEKVVNGIMKQIAEKTKKPLQEYYEKYIWKLTEKYGTAYNAFKLILSDPDVIFDAIDVSDSDERKEISHGIMKKMRLHMVKAYAEIDLMCFRTGIDAIKTILQSGNICVKHQQKYGEGESIVSIHYVGAPTYSLSTTSFDRQCALQTLHRSIEIMKKISLENDGELIVKKHPFIVGEEKDFIDKIMDQIESDDSSDSSDSDCENNDTDKNIIGTKDDIVDQILNNVNNVNNDTSPSHAIEMHGITLTKK